MFALDLRSLARFITVLLFCFLIPGSNHFGLVGRGAGAGEPRSRRPLPGFLGEASEGKWSDPLLTWIFPEFRSITGISREAPKAEPRAQRVRGAHRRSGGKETKTKTINTQQPTFNPAFARPGFCFRGLGTFRNARLVTAPVSARLRGCGGARTARSAWLQFLFPLDSVLRAGRKAWPQAPSFLLAAEAQSSA